VDHGPLAGDHQVVALGHLATHVSGPVQSVGSAAPSRGGSTLHGSPVA
jgi:hypothetical protein